MGFSTDFTGAVSVTPPLNAVEIEYLRLFAATRHDDSKPPEDDYYVDGMSNIGKRIAGPGWPLNTYWCCWIATPDGSGIQCDGSDKFYDPDYWMQWIIDNFLRPDAYAKGVAGFEEFTFDHHVNGSINIEFEGPDGEDCDIDIFVSHNAVTLSGRPTRMSEFVPPESATSSGESVKLGKPGPDETVLNAYSFLYDWKRTYTKDQKSIEAEYNSAGQLIALNYGFGDGRYFTVSLEAATKLGLEMKFIAKQWMSGNDEPHPPLPLTGPLPWHKHAVYVKGPDGWKNRDDDQEELSEVVIECLERWRAMGLI